MAPSPPPSSSPKAASNRERSRGFRTERALSSAEPGARGTRTTRRKSSALHGAYSSGDENDASGGGVSDDDDSIDGWRAKTYPAAAAAAVPSRKSHRRIHRPLARRGQSVGRDTPPVGRDHRSRPPAAAYSEGGSDTNDDGLIGGGGRGRRTRPSSETRSRARAGGRPTGERQQRREPGNWRPSPSLSPRSPDRAATGDAAIFSPARRWRERGRSVDRGATHQGKGRGKALYIIGSCEAERTNLGCLGGTRRIV